MYFEPNPRNLHGFEHTQYMQKPHRFKRRHIQLQKVISPLESLLFLKRQLKKIHRDQNRLKQFKMKKNFTQQLNYDIQGIVKAMQTEDGR